MSESYVRETQHVADNPVAAIVSRLKHMSCKSALNCEAVLIISLNLSRHLLRDLCIVNTVYTNLYSLC